MKNYFLSIFYGIAWLIIGTKCLISPNVYWNWLGFILYIVGFVLIALASWWTMWDKFIEKTQAMQYLFDSARHLDNERLAALLNALGFKMPKYMPVQEYKTSITINQADHNNVITNTRNIFDLPISPDKLSALADALINQQVNYSRRELVGRGILTDQEHRNLQPVFEREGIIELKNPGNPNAGFKLSDYGQSVLQQYAPSPTPHMEEVNTPA